jgi:hypothetical protein
MQGAFREKAKHDNHSNMQSIDRQRVWESALLLW